jgi:hypothetical protein
LHAHIKERLEGQEFSDVNQVLQRALAQESRAKEHRKVQRFSEKHKVDRPGVNVVEYEDDSSDDDSVDICIAEWTWKSKSKPFVCSALKPTPQKNRQEEMKFTFDVTKCDRIFDLLLQEKQISLSPNHVIPSLEEIKKRAYCKWHNSYSHATNDCNVFCR